MGLDDIDPDEDEEQKHIWIRFDNPRHPDVENSTDEIDELRERNFDSVEEIKKYLGPSVANYLGQAAYAAVEGHFNENPEAMRDFANKLLKDTGWQVELIEEDD